MTPPSAERSRPGVASVRGALIAAALVGVIGAVVACGGRLSLSDYADEAETLVAEMNAEVDAAEADYEAGVPNPERLGAAMARRAAARAAFVAALAAMEPPEPARLLHETAIRIVTALGDAERAVATGAAAAAPGDEESLRPLLAQLEDADREAVAVCEAAQEAFDATADRKVLSDTYWIPAELKEVVDIAFRCTAAERGGG